MRLKIIKKMTVISSYESKNPKYRTYNLVSTEEKSPDVLTVFGVYLPVEPMKEYTFDINLTVDKKTLTEAGKRVQYDICKLFLNGIIE